MTTATDLRARARIAAAQALAEGASVGDLLGDVVSVARRHQRPTPDDLAIGDVLAEEMGAMT